VPTGGRRLSFFVIELLDRVRERGEPVLAPGSRANDPPFLARPGPSG
jgi:hypothetical protein